jgi:broad specificity phosphatase PhoE
MSKLIKKKEIYLIRHGETDWNNLKKMQGCENDIELNDNGREQSKKTGKYLYNYRLNSGDFDLIISSGMKRAHETAEIIAKQVGYSDSILIIDNFREKCHGDLSGKTKEEMKTDDHYKKYLELEEKEKKEIDPIKQREIYYKNNKKFNKLYGTELIKTFRKTIKKGLKQLYERPEKKIIIVSHSATIMELLKIITGIEDYIPGNGSNCNISYLKLYEMFKENKIKRKFKIIKLMNSRHLK